MILFRIGVFLMVFNFLPRGSGNVFIAFFWFLYVYATPKHGREYVFRAARQKNTHHKIYPYLTAYKIKSIKWLKLKNT